MYITYIIDQARKLSPELLAIIITITVILVLVFLIIGFRFIRAGVIEDKFWKIFFGVCLTGFGWGIIYYLFKKDQLKREAKEIEAEKLAEKQAKEKKVDEFQQMKDDIARLKGK